MIIIFFKDKFNHLLPAGSFFSFLFLLIIFSNNSYAAAPGLMQATPAMGVSAVDADGNIQDQFSGGDIEDHLPDGIDTYIEPVPYVYDWDSDGKKDLLVGFENYDGLNAYVNYYRNVNTDADPILRFVDRVKVDASCGMPNNDLWVNTGWS